MICSCRQRSSRRRRSAGQSRCGGARGEAGRGRARTRIQSPSCTSTRQRCTSTPTATTACHGQMSRARRLSARGGHQARSSRTVEPALLDAPSRSAQTAPRHLDTAPTHRRSARRGGRKRPPHGLIRGCGENELTGRTGCPPLLLSPSTGARPTQRERDCGEMLGEGHARRCGYSRTKRTTGLISVDKSQSAKGIT